MRRLYWTLALLALPLAAAHACGGDDSTSTGAAGSKTTSATTGAGGTTGSATTGATSTTSSTATTGGTAGR
jgi:hypothetical protein